MYMLSFKHFKLNLCFASCNASSHQLTQVQMFSPFTSTMTSDTLSMCYENKRGTLAVGEQTLLNEPRIIVFLK